LSVGLVEVLDSHEPALRYRRREKSHGSFPDMLTMITRATNAISIAIFVDLPTAAGKRPTPQPKIGIRQANHAAHPWITNPLPPFDGSHTSPFRAPNMK